MFGLPIFSFGLLFLISISYVQCSELVAGMLVLGDQEHQARLEGTEAYAELKKVKAESRAVLDENMGLRDRISQLEQELVNS